MEVLARDLRSLGLYTARSLSYDGVEYELIEHQLTDEQRHIYDSYAAAFAVIHGNLDAAMEAAKLRFRPILMTAFAFILGVVPLMLATGAGAVSRVIMGSAVFWGMLVATIGGVLIIPGLYVFMEKFSRKKKAPAEAPAPAPEGSH